MKKLLLVLVAFLRLPEVYAVTTTDEQIQMAMKSQSPQLINGTTEQNNLIAYAWSVSHNLDFILTIEKESGRRWDAKGDGETSYGLCQRHLYYHWRVNNPDPTIANGYAMVDACRKTWQLKGKDIGNWLHGYRVRQTVRDRFLID